MLDRERDSITRLTRGVSATVGTLLMVALVVFGSYGVVTRYVLGSPSPWTEEVLRIFLVWMTFWGAAALAHSDQNLKMTLISDRLTGLPRRVLLYGVRLVSVAAVAFLLVEAVPFLTSTSMLLMPATRIPVWVVLGGAGLGLAMAAVGVLLPRDEAGDESRRRG